MSMKDKAFPDHFFEGPAISFERQPNLKTLFNYLITPDKDFTFIVGAGVSLDANLPTWARLVENITELIPSVRWRDASKEDHAELLRKAESSLQLAREGSNDTRNEIIRNALYRRSDGSANSEPAFGRLADVIARLTTWLGGRVYIATTNFDTLLEDAMDAYRLDCSEPIDSVPFIAPKVSDVDYDSYQETGIPGNWLPGSTVLHLHGILEPGNEPVGNIVLTETDFLKYGPAVRDLIKRRLKSSHVVFVGASLTDPNLVSPLWEVCNEPSPGTGLKESFLLSVAAPDPKASDVNRSRAYSVKKAQYLSDELQLRTIFLKSYGQQIQAIAEASVALLNTSRYMADNNPTTSSRYGHRLKRCLDSCYTNIGCGANEDIPDGRRARQLSARLSNLLKSDHDGSFNHILKKVHDRLRYSNDTDLRTDYESGTRYFENENFGVFLWLRARKDGKHPAAPYHLVCVGTSVYQHSEPWSFDRVAEIEGKSRFTSGRAAYYGSPKTDNIPSTGDWLLWHSVRAVPFSYYEEEATPGVLADARQAGAITAIDVGVITLNSTHNYKPLNESRWSKTNPRSLFSVMNDDEKEAVNDELARIALEVVSTTPAQ
ncbi:SIR2 family protein [Mycobacterium sp. UM_Kg1]|uniref:SIR2 family protein n=1 Tax=Mycobacterium sp. UM_Kg1 TaxID=1545691 RepID=UPI00061AFEA3|nr:SIR2 family protein [Mycobacterium sp. UM_Kg1]